VGALAYATGQPWNATQTNIDQITVAGTAAREVFLVAASALTPGITVETSDVAEIEMEVDLGGGTDFLLIAGTSGDDTLTMGSKGANWSDDQDGDDIVWNSSVEIPGFAGNPGGDTVSAMGGRGTGAPSPFPVFLSGGSDLDHLTGGLAGDWLNGGSDNDRLNGGPGSDRLGESPFRRRRQTAPTSCSEATEKKTPSHTRPGTPG